MRKQVDMAKSIDDKVTISLHDDNSVTTTSPSDDCGKKRRRYEFVNLFSGNEYFLQMIGKYHLDGYNIIIR